MEALKQIKQAAQKAVDQAETTEQVSQLRVEYLGRKGQVNQFVSQIPREDLRQVGRSIQTLKQELETMLVAREEELLAKSSPALDVTVPGERPVSGHLHLVTQAIEEIEDIFSRLGFVRRRYNEVELDWYAAEGLNIPPEHPARDDQETFYLTDSIVLTAHTSNGQLREMERVGKPPIKMINIGKTYRRQADVSHTPMFHQFEGLVIDEGINLTHLVGVLNFFAQHYFGELRRIRLRPHHFQFTEPSFEVDISCDICEGTGRLKSGPCRLCKAGWLELGGAGMVHPQVMKNGKINSKKYTGFAFGWGVERVLMMKSGLRIRDLRQLYVPDYRFLSQF
jgi:phenylalanyl-tRNA synthetase alpha chain